MRENRPYGSEGGESGSTGLPYPYRPESLFFPCVRCGPWFQYLVVNSFWSGVP